MDEDHPFPICIPCYRQQHQHMLDDILSNENHFGKSMADKIRRRMPSCHQMPGCWISDVVPIGELFYEIRTPWCANGRDTPRTLAEKIVEYIGYEVIQFSGHGRFGNRRCRNWAKPNFSECASGFPGASYSLRVVAEREDDDYLFQNACEHCGKIAEDGAELDRWEYVAHWKPLKAHFFGDGHFPNSHFCSADCFYAEKPTVRGTRRQRRVLSESHRQKLREGCKGRHTARVACGLRSFESFATKALGGSQ